MMTNYDLNVLKCNPIRDYGGLK